MPKQYKCVELESEYELFSSTRFGDSDYARLLSSIDPSIVTGAEDGSEMGVFSRDKNPVKEQGLLLQYQEYMPVGLNPVLIYMR